LPVIGRAAKAVYQGNLHPQIHIQTTTARRELVRLADYTGGPSAGRHVSSLVALGLPRSMSADPRRSDR
jgi:hypothetical protein